MSASREFVDASILVYAYDRTAGAKHDAAAALLERIWRDDLGQVSVQVLQEFFVTVTRKVARPMDIETAESRLRELTAWPVFAPTGDDVLAAIAVARKSRLSLWDAMILHAAAESGCAICWTEDLNPGQRWRGVEIRNPFTTGAVKAPPGRTGRAKGM
jgi:predicted nucleic acid-binding protein